MHISSLAQNNLSYSLETAAGAGFGKGPLFTLCPQFVFQDKFDSGMELDLPFFLRIGYGKNHFFSNVDAGYAIGIISTTNLGAVSGGRTKLSYNGLFCEPQVDDMVSKEVTTRNQFTPAITFRYVFFFGRKK